MLRLDRRLDAQERTTLTVQGEVSGPWVRMLEEHADLELARIPSAELTLELAQMTYADADGRALLARLRRRGVGLVGCSPLIEAQLDEEAIRDEAL